MPQTALPNIGLDYEWDLGADGWKTAMDDNLALLDNLAQARINFQLKSVSAQPGSPNNGDAYIIGASPTGADWTSSPTRENSFAVWYTNTGWHFAAPREGWRIYDAADNRAYQFNGTDWVEIDHLTFIVSLSDLTSAITGGDDAGYFRAPHNMTLVDVKASLLTASGGSPAITTINIRNRNASPEDILSTALTIDGGELTSETAVTPAVISNAVINADDDLRFDIDGVDSVARGLQVTLIGFYR